MGKAFAIAGGMTMAGSVTAFWIAGSALSGGGSLGSIQFEIDPTNTASALLINDAVTIGCALMISAVLMLTTAVLLRRS